MNEEIPATQFSKSDISIEVSQRSAIEPHGAAEAIEKIKAKPKFSDYACTPYEVEMFIKKIVNRVIPSRFWGSRENQDHIWKCEIVSYLRGLRKLSTGNAVGTAAFLRYRRYETTSVHLLLQGFSILDCDWLRLPSASLSKNAKQKPNQIEMEFRKEMLMEFVFWYLDSFIIDLVKVISLVHVVGSPY